EIAASSALLRGSGCTSCSGLFRLPRYRSVQEQWSPSGQVGCEDYTCWLDLSFLACLFLRSFALPGLCISDACSMVRPLVSVPNKATALMPTRARSATKR